MKRTNFSLSHVNLESEAGVSAEQRPEGAINTLTRRKQITRQPRSHRPRW